ncbi:MAG: MipA/OmpV family protein [Pseudomonadota bacterium]
MRVVCAKLFLLAACTLWPLIAASETVPLWRLGAGIGGFSTPHYLGAAQSHERFLPTPFFEYNGEVFKADRNGVRASVYERGNFEIGFSGSGSLPLDSDDNDAREGMDDLDLVVEPGLAAQFTLNRDATTLWRVDLPLRPALTVSGDGIDHIGWTSFPRLYYAHSFSDWSIRASAGVLLGDSDYHDYFYTVRQRDVRADRSLYRAKGGITATRLSLSVRRKIGDFYFAGLLNLYSLRNADNRDSPLFRENTNYALGFVVARVFSESTTRVRRKID